MKSSSAAPLRLPGMTSRFVKGRSGAELPISRQSSTHDTAAFRSSGWGSALASICIRSSGLVPVKQICPRLLRRTTPPYNVQEAAGGLNLALVPVLHSGTPPGRSANPECQDQDCSCRRRLPRLQCCGEQTQLTNRRHKLLTSPDSINDIRSIGKIRISLPPCCEQSAGSAKPTLLVLIVDNRGALPDLPVTLTINPAI